MREKRILWGDLKFKISPFFLLVFYLLGFNSIFEVRICTYKGGFSNVRRRTNENFTRKVTKIASFSPYFRSKFEPRSSGFDCRKISWCYYFSLLHQTRYRFTSFVSFLLYFFSFLWIRDCLNLVQGYVVVFLRMNVLVLKFLFRMLICVRICAFVRLFVLGLLVVSCCKLSAWMVNGDYGELSIAF